MAKDDEADEAETDEEAPEASNAEEASGDEEESDAADETADEDEAADEEESDDDEAAGEDEADEDEAADEEESGDDDDEEEEQSKDAAEESKEEPLPGEGTKEGDALRAAHAAFDVGDYTRVRELAEPLLEAKDEDIARAAREIHRRTEVDPVQIGVILACLVLFGMIAYVYVF